MKVALVHDDFNQEGGAENLFATIARIYKDAPIYTSQVNWQKIPQSIDRTRIITSWMQIIPFAQKFFKAYLPFYPLAFESFNFDEYDVVISSTTRFAKALITKPRTVHICYINSLPRFLWEEEILSDYLPRSLQVFFSPFLNWLRRWDKVVSSRPDYYIANSKNIARKLKKIYARDSQIIYPFADIEFFKPVKINDIGQKSQKYFLIVSRLVKWKKIDLAIKTAKKLDICLKIVGQGPDEARLRKLAVNSRIYFLGRVTKEELRTLYQHSQSLIVTQKEDFGIATVEAQACGRPVIAYKNSGAAEIVKNKRTGVLFYHQSVDALSGAIKVLSRLKWNVSDCRENALKFSRSKFTNELISTVNFYATRS